MFAKTWFYRVQDVPFIVANQQVNYISSFLTECHLYSAPHNILWGSIEADPYIAVQGFDKLDAVDADVIDRAH
jgi:hypothetical protein